MSEEYFEEENNKKLAETHYPYVKELEPVFWKRQEEILRQIEQKELEQTSKQKQITAKWTDYPPIITEDHYLFDDFQEMIYDFLENNKYDKQQVSTSGMYVEPRPNCKGVLSKEKAEFLLSKTLPEEYDEIVFEISHAFSIWEVIQPTHLYPLPNGQWFSERWRPEIWDGKKWVSANEASLKNWSKIPKDFKRVSFCLGLIPESGAICKMETPTEITSQDVMVWET